MKNKRRFSRILYRAPARIVGHEDQHTCEIIDLSLKGCLIQLPESFQPQAKHLYELQIPLNPGNEIQMQVMLVHCQDERAGFQCRYIDLQSISLLRRLIELNLGHYKQLERDLNALYQENP
ncbi:MAG: hypothetical protein AXA67_06230 [Methylothermaceae bacteria B42]|nr:MAG: hypothetical protein AXA67_06230 [Methylothermaceae bacteria B42]HHJ39865.1 PilZ domain-containing protein [Methylothermaceae bacterium]